MTTTTQKDTTTTQPEASIHSRAMLVDLHISFWRARKYDKKVTAEVNRQHGATEEAGRYNKNLLGGRWPSHRAVASAKNELRRIHHEMTLPWGDDGTRLLPNSLYFRFSQKMRAAINEFNEKADAFEDDYHNNILGQVKDLLNGMYRPGDYPQDVRSKFDVTVTYLPVPAAGDFRVDLPADEMMRVEESVNERVATAQREAMRDAWDRLYDMVAKIHDRFAKSLEERDEDERAYHVRQSLLDQARELADLLGDLNITDDPELEKMRERVTEELIGDGTADALRDDDDQRRDTVDKSKKIMDAMKDIYGGPEED